MDIVDFILAFILVLVVSVLLGLIVGVFVDANTNGLDDCRDDPQYCNTVQEYKKYWPEYQVPKESIK